MINSRLKTVCTEVDDWCRGNSVKYDIVCDESDLQGFMLFKRDRSALAGLIEHLRPVITQGNVHLEMRKVRGGNILAFSLKALSESQIAKILAEAGEEEIPMSFKERISDAFAAAPPVIESEEGDGKINFLATAQKLTEGQRKSATGGMTRANQTSQQRQQHETDTTQGGVEHPASVKANDTVHTGEAQATKGPKKGAGQAAKGATMRFENRIRSALELPPTVGMTEFDITLNETLQGIATTTGQQPGELFNQFARALQVLGQQMGIGPLQDQLKQQGIQWKKSDDGMAIILYIDNAKTGAPQPIARITAETLESPRDFEDQLTNMLDFAKGEAPGSLRQKQQEMKDQEGAIRDIAQAISPEDQESEVSKQMNQPQSGVATAAPAAAPTPAAPATQATAQATAPQAAAKQAALPKQTLAAGKIKQRSRLI